MIMIDHEFTLELSGGQAMLITKMMIVSLRECNIDHMRLELGQELELFYFGKHGKRGNRGKRGKQ